MKIKLKELEQAILKMVEKLYMEGHYEIDLGDFDLYWTILTPDCTDMSRPPELSVGSIRDDLDSLQKLSNLNDRPMTYVDFDRLATILHLISERLNPGKPAKESGGFS